MKRIATAVAAVTTAAAALVATSAPASASTEGFYKTAYDDTVYFWYSEGGVNSHVPITLEEYLEAGSPPVQTIGSDYVKYPWAEPVWAVTSWPGEEWQWDHLDGGMWARAGFPAPRAAGWIEGSGIYKFDTSDELFLTEPLGSNHKLTFPEWVATGQRPVDAGAGSIAKYPFLPTIFYWDPTYTVAETYSYEVWQYLAYPTPATRGRIIGDSWTRPADDPQITLTTPDGEVVDVTFEMWAAAGFPEPEIV